jgi:hypothetical protein
MTKANIRKKELRHSPGLEFLAAADRNMVTEV